MKKCFLLISVTLLSIGTMAQYPAYGKGKPNIKTANVPDTSGKPCDKCPHFPNDSAQAPIVLNDSMPFISFRNVQIYDSLLRKISYDDYTRMKPTEVLTGLIRWAIQGFKEPADKPKHKK